MTNAGGRVPDGAKLRILFVDDEQAILDGLRNQLRRFRSMWEMTFACGGPEGVKLLEATPFDAVVTDMRMPVIDGAAMLQRTHEIRPQAVRIVLSGHSELEGVLRVVPVAHRYLAKPCDPDELQGVLLRAGKLRSIVANETVKRVVGQLHNLPPVPRLYVELTRLLEGEGAGAPQVAQVLAQDIAMSAKLLQLVNSAFFRASRKISTVEDAVTYLGLDALKTLVLSAEVFRASSAHEKVVDTVQRHCFLVARLASGFLPGRPSSQEAFLGGMMHDVGRLLLATQLPKEYAEINVKLEASPARREQVELSVLGTTHAAIGAYLLSLWGLPESVIEAAGCHHSPAQLGHSAFDVVDAVHVADALAHECAGDSAELDMEWLGRLGVEDRLDGWRALARKVVEAAAA